MKRLILLLFIPVLMFGQIRTEILNSTYANDDTVTTITFPIYNDSLEFGFQVTDTVDVQFWVQYSVSGVNFTQVSDSLMHLDFDAACDTSVGYRIPEPANFYGRLYVIFAGSGNDSQGNGYVRAWVKSDKQYTKPNY